MKLDVYEQLLRINAVYDQILRGWAALRKYSSFPGGELDRFTALSKESRSAANSFLTGAMETAETQDAGRRFRRRVAQEQGDERET